jgi:hypothetical protein
VTVYLYGLVLGRSVHLVPADITGVASSAVRVVSCDQQGLGALVSTVESPPRRASLDDVRAHDHALQLVVHHGPTAAAVRFGQVFASDDDVCDHLSEQGARIARVLEEFDGCVEMRLLVAETDSDTPAEPEPVRGTDPGGPGRQYLESLRPAAAALPGLALRPALGPIVRAEKVERLGTRGAVFSHLIARADERAYRQLVSSMPALADARLIGPLPLYSFVAADE